MKSIISFSALVLGCFLINAGTYDVIDGFQGFDFKNKDKVMPYRLFIPDKLTPGKKYPLIMVFHGMGSIGKDNKAQLFLAGKVAKTALLKHQCFILAPQCPADARWVTAVWNAEKHQFQPEPTWPMSTAMDLLEQTLRKYPIDPKQLYVGGASMGGFATWDIITRLPGKFAAGFPICGGGDPSQAALITHTPVWVFHGARDSTVLVSSSREMVDALKKAGASPRYTEYPGIEHDSWNNALDTPELYDWLFSCKKSSMKR